MNSRINALPIVRFLVIVMFWQTSFLYSEEEKSPIKPPEVDAKKPSAEMVIAKQILEQIALAQTKQNKRRTQ